MRLFALLFALTPAVALADLDVVFLLDTTGSMGGEIQEAKERVRQIAETLSKARPNQRVRIGVVAYRDKGDEYLTKVSPLGTNVNASFAFLASLRADGGGDAPEDVLSGLRAALYEMNWDETPQTERQVFLIGDAPAQLYKGAPTPEELIAEALSRRIVVNAIGCRSLSANGQEQFRRLAFHTEGSYQHIGRVRTEEAGLAKAMLKALAPTGGDEQSPNGPAVRVLLKERTERATELALRPVTRAGKTCGLSVSLPPGLGLLAPPKVTRGDGELAVELSLSTGRGGSETYELSECVPAATPLRALIAG